MRQTRTHYNALRKGVGEQLELSIGEENKPLDKRGDDSCNVLTQCRSSPKWGKTRSSD